MIKEQPPLQPNEEYVSCDVDCLITNVPIQETIEYILYQIYVKNKLPHICKPSIAQINNGGNFFVSK